MEMTRIGIKREYAKMKSEFLWIEGIISDIIFHEEAGLKKNG